MFLKSTVLDIFNFHPYECIIAALLALKMFTENSKFVVLSGLQISLHQGCKIPLAHSHWRVNFGFCQVKYLPRSPLWASAFSDIVKCILAFRNDKTKVKQRDDIYFLNRMLNLYPIVTTTHAQFLTGQGFQLDFLQEARHQF